jgi:MtN3 and saliva related transmembrane protein
MENIHIGIAGLIAGACTTVSFIPQILKIFKTRKVRDISTSMYLVLTTGIFLWLIYGIFLGELPIILANGISFILCVSILAMKFFYGKEDAI